MKQRLDTETMLRSLGSCPANVKQL